MNLDDLDTIFVKLRYEFIITQILENGEALLGKIYKNSLPKRKFSKTRQN